MKLKCMDAFSSWLIVTVLLEIFWPKWIPKLVNRLKFQEILIRISVKKCWTPCNRYGKTLTCERARVHRARVNPFCARIISYLVLTNELIHSSSFWSMIDMFWNLALIGMTLKTRLVKFANWKSTTFWVTIQLRFAKLFGLTMVEIVFQFSYDVDCFLEMPQLIKFNRGLTLIVPSLMFAIRDTFWIRWKLALSIG